jgi:hypothetical protein
MNKHLSHVLLVALTTSAVAMGVGCQKDKGADPQTPLSAPSTPVVAVAAPQPSNKQAPDVVSKQEAWKADAVTTFDAILPDQQAWSPLAISPDGVFLVNLPRQKYNGTASTNNQVILYDQKSGKTETVATMKDSSIVSGDINENWVVWTEALDQYFTKWRIHAYDRRTKTEKVLVESYKDAKGNGFAGPLVMPKLYGDQMVWSPTTGEPTERGTSVFVKQIDLNTGKITDIAAGANPIMTKDFTLWVGRDDALKSGALFWNRGGQVQQITKGKTINYFATDGHAVVWSEFNQKASTKEHDDSRWNVGLIEDGKERILLTTEASDALQFLTMGSRIVAWTAYKYVQVYDRKIDKIVTLETKDAEYSQVYANDNYLYWTTPIPQTEDERKQARQNGIYPCQIHLVDLRNL